MLNTPVFSLRDTGLHQRNPCPHWKQKENPVTATITWVGIQNMVLLR